MKKKYFEAFEILKEKEKIVIINGDRSAGEISKDIWKEVSHTVELENTLQ